MAEEPTVEWRQGMASPWRHLSGVTVLEYPKSGRTWTLCLLAQLISSNVAHSVIQTDSSMFLKASGLKYSHGERITQPDHPYKTKRSHFFELNRTAAALRSRLCAKRSSPRLILLERDPRDVVVSSYYERRYRGGQWGYAYYGTLSGFLREHRGGLASLIGFNAAVHAGLLNVSACLTRANFYYLRYERLWECAACELRSLAAFLRADASEPRVRAAVDRCSLDVLRDLNTSSTKWGEAIKGLPASNKFRSGVVGGFRSELNKADQTYLNGALAAACAAPFGHERARCRATPRQNRTRHFNWNRTRHSLGGLLRHLDLK